MHRRDLCKWSNAQCAQRALAIEIAIVANVKFLTGDRLAGRTDKSVIKLEYHLLESGDWRGGFFFPPPVLMDIPCPP